MHCSHHQKIVFQKEQTVWHQYSEELNSARTPTKVNRAWKTAKRRLNRIKSLHKRTRLEVKNEGGEQTFSSDNKQTSSGIQRGTGGGVFRTQPLNYAKEPFTWDKSPTVQETGGSSALSS